jgi:transcriptional regulator with XRE-family HTH domain
MEVVAPGPTPRNGADVTASSRVGERLRAARARAGWTREALAYHSGVSWSAIAQIESGRRTEVRPSTLTALAASLHVSVDHLIGSAATTTTGLLEHRLLAYGSDEEFLAGTGPLVAEGLERDDAVLVVTDREHIGHLRDAVDGVDQIEFADSAGWYSSPSDALARYRSWVDQKVEAGSLWVRIVGEPVWAGCSDAETAAWTRYESLINLVLGAAPVTLVCPYDTSAVPSAVVADAHRTHPGLAHGTTAGTISTYCEPEHFLLEP